MKRLICYLVFIALLTNPAYTQAVKVFNLFDFNNSFQGWELAEGSNYGDLHRCGGEALASWIGWDKPEWKLKGLALPAGKELTFQSSYLGDYSLAIEFLADIWYYSLPGHSKLPLEARLYLLTDINPLPHFGSWTYAPDVSYRPNSNNPLLHYGEWTTLSPEPTPNLLSLAANGISGLDNIQAIGVSVRSGADFRGKVKMDNIRVNLRAIPEPATVFLLGFGLVALLALKRFRNKTQRLKLRLFSSIFIALLCLTIVWEFQSTVTAANRPQGQVKAKLDPKLQLLMSSDQEIETKTTLAKSQIFTLKGQPALHCIIKMPITPNEIEELGGVPGSQFGNIMTAMLPIQALEQLLASPKLVYLEASRPAKLTLAASVPAIKADLVHNRLNADFTGYTGKGVIIGDIHSGIDFTHPDFINTDGSSRILFTWDQTDNDGPPPAGFIYGTEWTQAQINAEIDGTPAGLVRQRDSNGHGTHTAGIAAGNGRATGNGYPADRYIGVAPEADLIIVKSDLQTATILDAINYIQTKAAELGKPCVINNSYSSQYGPHDGTQNWEIAFDNATGAGKVLVVSAGNNGNHHNISPVPAPPPDYNTLKQIHARGIAMVGSNLEITFEVPTYTADPGILNDAFEMDLWYQGSDQITVTLTTPGGVSHSKSTGAANIPQDTDEGTIWINNASSGPNPNNGDNECYIYVADRIETKAPASGTWKITIAGIELPEGGAFDIWASYNTLTDDPYEVIFNSNFVNEVLVGSPGTALKPITVGAYSTRNEWTCPTGDTRNWPYDQVIGDVAWYSSPGPRRDGVLKPEISAPGSNIAATRSYDWNTSVEFMADDSVHALKHGTSMSTAHVTGAVALLLQKNPLLSNAEVKTILTDAAVADAFTGTVPNAIWGYGKLDIYAAMNGTKCTQTISGTGQYIFPFPNGNVIIDFTQHTGTAEVTVEMFISPPPNSGGKALPRHFNITTTAQNFEATLTFYYSQDEFDEAGFTGGESGLYLGRSTDGGQTWQPLASAVDDFNNTVAASGVTSFSLWAIGAEGAMPIELTGFTASVRNNNVILNWNTASETNNLGFEIQRRKANAKFVKIDFATGAGTVSEPRAYDYVDANLPAGSYYYRLKQIDSDGSMAFSRIVSATIAAHPTFCLYPNYPNPFNPSTTIQYDLPLQSHVELKVYNVFGQEVVKLVDKQQPAGHYSLTFNAGHLASGMYFYQLSTARFTKIQKMIYIR